MSWEDKIFWLVVSMPIIPCVICFMLGGIIGTVTMALLNAATDYKDPYTEYYDYSENEGGEECNLTNTEL